MPSRSQIEQLLKDDPNDVFLNYALAMSFQGEGRSGEAVDQFRKTLQLDAGYVAAYFQLGQVLAQSGAVDEAREALRDGIVVAARLNDQHAEAEMTAFLDTL